MDKSAALTILTTEHYTLQMARTATITDAASRAGHLLTTISASMIALGFAAQVVPPQVLLALMLVIFSGLFLIGLATLFRTVELTIEVVEAVTHHVEEEEKTVLPGMKRRLSEDRRHELGARFAHVRADHLGDIPGQASREELLAQARNLGLEGATSMSKAELQKQMQKAGSKGLQIINSPF